MAKSKSFSESNKKVANLFPSAYGSHKTMIDEEATAKLNDPSKVVIKDEYGTYVTDRNRLDSGLADPNRYATARLSKLYAKNSDKEDK